ncbi:Hypothetical predicted protein [Paramuricea clavata]|uniref:Uncharacterized protein n=1 Tax=Paramuricea clavata TaxID=317549 RepID=A0A6S7G2P9_PARCT|nr:Hypothetical predicted protein [Paramuricea clavata]
MNIILPAYILEGSAEPEFKDPVQEEWYEQEANDCSAVVKAKAADKAFHMIRQYHDPKPGWTMFNEEHSETDLEVSTVGYMPIILALAHDVNTLNTVVRIMTQVAKLFGQRYIVLTVDQALFPQLMELKWAVPEYRDTLIPRLGGLHISMNFLKFLGQHVQDSGLSEIWVESILLGPRTVEHVLDGKEYSKGVRAHKVTLQAMCQILLPQLLAYIRERDKDLKESLHKFAQSHTPVDFERMSNLLSSDCYSALLLSFVAAKKESNPSFQFWWQYTKMEAVLDKLQNIVTKDVATAEIQEFLLNAPGLGKEKLLTFVKERLVLQINGTEKKLRDPLPKNKAPTFATLREVEMNVAKCSPVNVDTTPLHGRHEEADMRMILHCVNSSAKLVVVCSNDTDVC